MHSKNFLLSSLTFAVCGENFQHPPRFDTMIRRYRSTPHDSEKQPQDHQGLLKLIRRRPEIPLQSTTQASRILDRTSALYCCRYRQSCCIRPFSHSDAENSIEAQEPPHETRYRFLFGSLGNDSSTRSKYPAEPDIEQSRIDILPSLHQPFLICRLDVRYGSKPVIRRPARDELSRDGIHVRCRAVTGH